MPRARYDVPPGPRRPAPLQTAWWAYDPNGLMHRLSRRFGPVFTIKLALGPGPFVVVGDPEGVRQIFAARRDQLHAGRANREVLPMMGDHSLLTLDGPRHRRERKLLMPPLHGERMRAYGDLIQGATRRAVSTWTPGSRPDVLETSTQISLEVIARAVFGVDGDSAEQTIRLLSRYLGNFGPALTFFPFLRRDLGPGSPGRRYRRTTREVRALIQQRIDHGRRHPNPDATDILALMLAARDEDGQPMTDAEIHDELVTLLLAGHETSAISLSWALGWILRDPHVRDRLVEEVRTTDDPEALARLPYLRAVCDETLRIQPVIPAVARQVMQPFEVLGHTYQPGVVLAAGITLVHHDPTLYPDPHRFDPTRFLDHTYGPEAYLPFGGGVRRCIGEAFARYELAVVLGTLLAERRLALVDARVPRAVRRNVTMGPKPQTRIRVAA